MIICSGPELVEGLIHVRLCSCDQVVCNKRTGYGIIEYWQMVYSIASPVLYNIVVLYIHP